MNYWNISFKFIRSIDKCSFFILLRNFKQEKRSVGQNDVGGKNFKRKWGISETYTNHCEMSVCSYKAVWQFPKPSWELWLSFNHFNSLSAVFSSQLFHSAHCFFKCSSLQWCVTLQLSLFAWHPTPASYLDEGDIVSNSPSFCSFAFSLFCAVYLFLIAHVFSTIL